MYLSYFPTFFQPVNAQTQLNVALEKERSAVEQHMTLKSRVGALETQLSGVKQERSQLLATVELERAKLETLEEGQHRYILCRVGLRLMHGKIGIPPK